jgi:hypothetical protein
MKMQIARFSPHQNGKVFGVLAAISSLILMVPFFLIFAATMPSGAPGSPPAYAYLLLPVVYLVFGYLSVAIGCLIYNLLFRAVGGIEFEARDTSAA